MGDGTSHIVSNRSVAPRPPDSTKSIGSHLTYELGVYPDPTVPESLQGILKTEYISPKPVPTSIEMASGEASGNIKTGILKSEKTIVLKNPKHILKTEEEGALLKVREAEESNPSERKFL